MTSRKNVSAELQDCLPILTYFQSRSDAEPFLYPVDWEALGLPDYPQIVKDPMDLETVSKRLKSGQYSTVDDFATDVRQIFENAKLYNQTGSEIYTIADQLQKLFDKKFSKVKGAGEAPSKKRKRGKGDSREATRQDRIKFSHYVNHLSSEQLGQLVNMIQKKCPAALNEEDDDELEIEINKIDGDVLLELNEFALDATSNSGKKKRK